MAGDATSTRRASRDGVEELNASEFININELTRIDFNTYLFIFFRHSPTAAHAPDPRWST